MNKSMIVKILVIMIVTAILGEFKISPFDSTFRFGLGSAGFFFLLLTYKDVPYPIVGFVTGLFTTFFRIGLDYLSLDSFMFFSSLQIHTPIIGYYLTFAILFHLIKGKTFNQYPILIGIYGALSDALSNLIELLLITINTTDDVFGSFETTYILTVAFLRSFFVVGLFMIFQTSRLNAVYEEQRVRFEQIQTILSELYIEGFYLKKTLNDIESVTAKGHKLYRELKSRALSNELSTLALTVAQELHEVKKDNQRILAGLEKVIKDKNSREIAISLSEIIELSIKSNSKLVDYLNIDVHISKDQRIDFKVGAVYPLLVIINNIIVNAIEAIVTSGEIKICCSSEHEQLKIEIIDNGVGITLDEQEVIFEPGYTTKFDETGKASTGIGLSHVQSMVNELGGTIKISSDNNTTSFIIHLPISEIKAKEVK